LEAQGNAGAIDDARALMQKNWFGDATPPLEQL
jgi:hypothetical protein